MQSRQQEVASLLIQHINPKVDINQAIVDKCGNEWETTAIQQACRYSLPRVVDDRSEEHTSELQSQGHISYAVFCLGTVVHPAGIKLFE